MSTITIAVLLLIPIVAVVVLLNAASKKQKRKADQRNMAYLNQVMDQAGVINSYQKKLVHQLVVLDEANKKLLVIDHVNNTYSHNLYKLDEIKSMEVSHVKQVIPSDEKNQKSESFTSHIGLEIRSTRVDQTQLLIFYDHATHSLYLMAELEREAKRLQERIMEVNTKKQLAT